MSVLVNKNSKIIVQGFTGTEGSFHATQMIEYGTNVVGGVTPNKGGTQHLERPVFNTVADAVKKVSNTKEVKTFPKDTDAQQNLISNRVDAWVTDKFQAMEVVTKNPTLKLQKGDLLYTEKIAMIVKKDNKALRDALNKALAETMADGSYKAVSEKYFQEDIRCK